MSKKIEKVYAVVARGSFPSQKSVKKLRGSDHFLTFRCRKRSKKCTPLWREAHFQVNSVKTWEVRTTFWRSDVVLLDRRKGLCTLSKVSKTWWFCSSFNYDYNYNRLGYTTVQPTPQTLHYATLHYSTPHYTTLQYTPLHYTASHYTTLHYATLHSTSLHYTTLHYTALKTCITLHYTNYN